MTVVYLSWPVLLSNLMTDGTNWGRNGMQCAFKPLTASAAQSKALEATYESKQNIEINNPVAVWCRSRLRFGDKDPVKCAIFCCKITKVKKVIIPIIRAWKESWYWVAYKVAKSYIVFFKGQMNQNLDLFFMWVQKQQQQHLFILPAQRNKSKTLVWNVFLTLSLPRAT